MQNKSDTLIGSRIEISGGSCIIFRLLIFAIICISQINSEVMASLLPEAPFAFEASRADTIPLVDRKGDFISDRQRNPFDITPSNIKQEIEYDPKTDRYYIIEKIGEEYYRNPTYMTFSEYLQWKSKQQEKEYFERLAGVEEGKAAKAQKRDPMATVDVSGGLVDRLFGGTEVEIKPQGTVELTLGIDYQKRDDPNLPLFAQRQILPDFNMNPRLSVDGKIGKKMNLGFNYDAQATFDFDQRIKLDYSSDAFSEDDIIKKIEAGQVSFPLRGSLIKGAESLFGLKTELQFGRLRLTALLSQQRSRQNSLRLENGAAVTEFEIFPDEYDENRHFFLSHFNRNNYERALRAMPHIVTSFRAVQIEVWISDDRQDYQDGSTMIAALADIANGELQYYDGASSTIFPPNPIIPTFLQDAEGRPLPDNRVNGLFQAVVQDEEAKQLDRTASVLRSRYNLQQTRDFEVFRGRQLNPSEYTFHPQLGTLSLNIRLRPNQVLGVAYKYYYTLRGDSVYTVGQLASEGLESSERGGGSNEITPPKVLFVKMLKSTNQQANRPSWDLMMKNVYNLRTSQLNSEGFEFDIFYEDDFDDGSLKKFIPIEGLNRRPLLELFSLDRLNRFGDPQADGIFDYVPGITVIERSGSIVFPVLEPFGSSLRNVMPEELAEIFSYQELYDTTVTIARQSLEKNKFVMIGKVKGSSTGEIQLGPFVPRGSVRVTAGGVTLIEGQDYEIDYSIGRLRIINPTYLAQGTPINVNYEDNTTFSLQQKNMIGLRAEYAFKKNISLGATFLRLTERPFSQKVNLGEDPIANQMVGLDLNFTEQLPSLTKLLDKLPFYSTKEMSQITFSGEFAALIPGTNSAINVPGESEPVVSIDDFEGAITGFTLGGFNTNAWSLCSTPPEFREHELDNDLRYGANRALLNWYQIDRSARRSDSDINHPYTRLVEQTDLFRRQIQPGLTELFTFDMSYWPRERGPYNFEQPNGYPGYTAGMTYDPNIGQYLLNNPKSRWAGIMRYFPNQDFEAANFEFIDFWVLNPFMERVDGEQHIEDEEGEIVFHLGNVSEDILRDGLQFFENTLPLGEENVPVANTNWGRAALNVPINLGFDLTRGREQDLGFNGLNDDDERDRYKDWLSQFNPLPAEYLQDPANDNFQFFGDPELQNEPDLIKRLKRFNGPQGNAPLDAGNTQVNFLRGNRLPDNEDMNNNRALDQSEAYYEYRIKIRNQGGEIDTVAAGSYYKQRVVVSKPNSSPEIWYRFQVPLVSGTSFGLSGFRSIQFMRLYLTNFETPKIFRLAEFQLLRSQWRRSDNVCLDDTDPSSVDFSIDRVGIFDNAGKQPFNYIMPAGIKQEIFFNSVAGPLAQDERSMLLKFCNLNRACQVAVNKLVRFDLTLYKRLQLFVHAEERDTEIPDGDLRIFLKFGKDMVNNYYEYEIPLVQSKKGQGQSQEVIWPSANFIDVDLQKFLEVKKLKLSDGILEMDDPDKPGAKIRIKGVPSLGLIKVFEVGVRNASKEQSSFCGEVWVNELRLVGMDQFGGVAGLGRMQIKLADLGELNLSGNFQTLGFGGINQRFQERERQTTTAYDIATILQLGKFLPQSVKINLPFYFQYSKSSVKPQFDPYQRDLTTDELLEITEDPVARKDIEERGKEVVEITTYNFTNVKIQHGGGKAPWSPDNFQFTYAYSETKRSDPIIIKELSKEQTFNFDYNYALKSSYLQPLKFIKSPALKILSEFNFNPLPSRYGFNSELNRVSNVRTFRLPVTPVFQFDDLRFRWKRNYTLDWDITKSIRINYRANVTSIVDELRQVGIADTPEDRDWVNERGEDYTQRVIDDPSVVSRYRWNNIKGLGRSRNFGQQLGVQYRLPFNLIPILDWVSVNADYRGEYNWTGGVLVEIDEFGNLPGNIIANNQSRVVNATFSFDKLYGKSKYLKKIDSPVGRARPQSRRSSKDGKEEKPEREPSNIERALVKPLLMLRNIRLTYREDFGTMVPGFNPNASLFGLSEGFGAPGWDFAFGNQPDLERSNPDNWLLRNSGWFNTSPNFNEQISQNIRQTISLKIALEPFRDVLIDVDFIKNFRNDRTQIFKFREERFEQLGIYDIGALDYSFFSLNTLFEDSKVIYARFRQNRIIVSNDILPNKPNAGRHPQNSDFAEGYGPTSYLVNVPAFMAAYTGKPVNEVTTDIIQDVRKVAFIPKPSWNVRYNGLHKLAAFKDLFSSVSIRHGYKSTMTIARFNSAPDFDDNNPFDKVSISNFNYYARLEIPALSVAEQFNPIIGIDVKTKSNMNISFEYKKSRMLDLRLSANELSETLGSDISFNFGYTIRNFKGFGGGSKRKARSKNKEEEKPKPTAQPAPRGGGRGANVGDLTINCPISIRDDINYIYRLENDADPQPRRGQQTISISPNVEYAMYEQLSLRFFVDYSSSKPYITNSFPITRIRGGVMARFILR